MGKTAREIEQEIAQARNRLGRDLDALQLRIRESVDWRIRFERNPAAFLAIAFAVGFLAGIIAVPRRQGREKPVRASSRLREPVRR
jgi:ElaB/YqjD/DUF883 family membrane-anchored ribosome-binding protein